MAELFGDSLAFSVATIQTIAVNSSKLARTRRALNDGTISASAVRTMHAPIKMECGLRTGIEILCVSVSLW